MIGIYGGWAMGALIGILWGASSPDVALGLAALFSNICMWGMSSNRAFFGLASLGGFSLAFRYVLLPVLLGIAGQQVAPEWAVTLTGWFSSEWFGCGVALFALLAGAFLAHEYVHGKLPAEGN